MSFATKVIFLVVLAALLTCVWVDSAAVMRRSEDAVKNATKPEQVCLGRTPCGWAVYNKMDRIIDYFLDNKCICEEGKRCIRDGDDLSIAAYVYRCIIPKKDHP